MAKNPFDELSNVDNNITRHNHDWQHQNSFSARLGFYYPLFSEIVPPNTKFKCKPHLGLQFMPMTFPVQTRMKARMSFFKVPLRILWDDYKDYVGNFRQGLEEPYHDIPAKDFEEFYGVSKLGDFLDIPNVIYGNNYNPTLTMSPTNLVKGGFLKDGIFNSNLSLATKVNSYDDITSTSDFEFQFYYRYAINTQTTNFQKGHTYSINLSGLPSQIGVAPSWSALFGTHTYKFDCKLVFVDSSGKNAQNIGYSLNGDAIFSGEPFGSDDYIGYKNIKWNSDFQFTYNSDSVPSSIFILFSLKLNNIQYSSAYTVSNLKGFQSGLTFYQSSVAPSNLPVQYINEFIAEYNVINTDTTPYYGSEYNTSGEKLTCYPARAYEAVYNSYFRDNRNNPFYVNGELQYNKWLPNYAGGADKTPYKLRRANWEKDFLTTAVHSPQQGKMPLVGLTQFQEVVNSDRPQLEYSLALVDENNNSYRVIYNADTSSVSISDILEDGTAVEPLNITQLVNSSSLGISIPDLRVVNAYQKFLELNIRKGYSYRDIIEGRFDCKVNFDELMMPEFIGGFTRDINMNRVVQSVDTNRNDGLEYSSYSGALGSLAGDAFLNSGDVPEISTFCDEECVIIGIMSVVPIPVYTQLLPKHYLMRDLLDHFQPEFNNLGFQPIKYKEVCPLQAKLFNKDLNDTFGYQRPWYEYVMKYDTAHGLLRTQLRNFLMNRQFNQAPVLNEDFLLVDDTQLNDVFAVTETTDKIIGQCYFDCSVELPVSRVAIPRLD